MLNQRTKEILSTFFHSIEKKVIKWGLRYSIAGNMLVLSMGKTGFDSQHRIWSPGADPWHRVKP